MGPTIDEELERLTRRVRRAQSANRWSMAVACGITSLLALPACLLWSTAGSTLGGPALGFAVAMGAFYYKTNEIRVEEVQ
ncbi:MAG: hypothetical protein H6721_27145 [Sandaracinus sp.]|nr:hypothetical protein [Sandaracinus sp.]MCB9613844.1 hypothetical protein [Sandaracinus sp.]MCB9635811.1 hypothetical protein [Sandaracinus sp.]